MVLLVCLFASAALVQEKPAPDKPADLSTDEILRKAVERWSWREAQKFDRKYVSTVHSINEEFDSSGALKTHVDRVVQTVPLGDRLRGHRVLEKDGKPTSAAERKAQWDNEQKAIAEESKNKRKPPARRNSSPEDEMGFNNAMVSKYNWKLLGTEVIDGRATYLLSLEPKKDAPVHSIIDHVLNKVAGKIWFDAQEFEIVRADAHLTENASILAGIVGSMKKADIFFEQARMDDGAWLTRKMNYQVDARIALFKTIREHQFEEYRDFRKITPELIAESRKPPVS
jgi:hypothetical protein